MSLRQQVLRGGSYLVLRQGIGTLINVAGVLLLTRTLGPRNYGIYAAAAGLFATVQLITQFGIPTFIVRHETQPSAHELRNASTLLMLFGFAGAIIMAALLPLVQSWTRIEQLGLVGLAVFAMLPLNNLAQVPLAMLDRQLDYRRVAGIELAGQALFFAVAVPLAMRGFGPWAPTLGWVSQQIALVLTAHAALLYLPRPALQAAFTRGMLRFGAAFTTSLWIYQLRRAVNPVLVGRYLGAEAVAIVALATQIVTHLNFITVATWRLSTAALSRVQADRPRLLRAVADGMMLQATVTAPLLVAFAWLAPVVIPALIGESWSNAAVLYPFIAAAALVAGAFAPHSSALYVLKQNGAMARFHLANTGLLALGTVLLVPRYGILGYGFAELLALGSYLVLHFAFVRNIGAPRYARSAALLIGFGIAVFVQQLGLWSLAGLAVALLSRPWRAVRSILAYE